MAESRARHILENFYDLEESLPMDIGARLSPQRPAPHHIKNTHKAPDEQAIVSILNDPRITLDQKEKISASILEGKFEFIQQTPDDDHGHSRPRLLPKNYEKQRLAELTVQRHRLPRANFLQVITQAAPIPAMSGKEAREQKIRVQLRMGASPPRSPEVPRTWPTQLTPQRQRGFHDSDITDEHTMEEMQPYNNTPKKSSLKDLQNQLVAEHTRRLMERSKLQMKLKTEQALHMRRLEEASAQKKMEVKKKLQEVRKALYKHLVKQRDPQVGSIMRLVDESLIYHFMEKYSGFSMSAQAILALVGTSLGTHVADPHIPTDEETPWEADAQAAADVDATMTSAQHTRTNTAESRVSDCAPLQGLEGGKSNSRRQLPQMTFDDSRYNTPVTGMTGGSSTANSGARESHSRGRHRSLLDREPSPPSIQRSARQCARITNDREFQSAETRMHPSRTGLEKEHTGAADPVRGVSPRRYHADRPISPDSKAWGSGFRVVPPHAGSPHSPLRLLAPITVTRPATVTLERQPSRAGSSERRALRSAGVMGTSTSRSLTRERSTVPGSPHRNPSFVLFGSDNVREAARAMGYVVDGVEITDDLASEVLGDTGLDGDAQSVFSQQSIGTRASRDSYHTTVPANAIAAMHEQLIEENLLPSMQPEPVLTQSQIEELGLHKKTFTDIMEELSKSNSLRSGSITDTEMCTDLPPLSQYSAPRSALLSKEPSGVEHMSDSAPITPKDSSNSVTNMVAQMMGSTLQARALFVEPLSATSVVPPPPKVYATLYGSVYSAADKERFENMRHLEVERGEQRHGIEQPPMSAHSINFDLGHGISPGKLPQLTQPPRGLKTKPSKLDEFGNLIPESPYKSYQEESKVLNTGVPAGAGYMLWRPRYRVSKEGRYRAGQSHVRLRTALKEGPPKTPFVSAT